MKRYSAFTINIMEYYDVQHLRNPYFKTFFTFNDREISTLMLLEVLSNHF